jgi:hypothetical protein
MKSTWKIINEEKGKRKSCIDIQSLVINNNVTINQNKIANIFNNTLFINSRHIQFRQNKHINTSMTNPINYLTNNFRRPFTKISWLYAPTYEIEKIIKSLKTRNACRYNEISNHVIKNTNTNTNTNTNYLHHL